MFFPVLDLILTAEDVVDLLEELDAAIEHFFLNRYEEFLDPKLHIFKPLYGASAALVFFLAQLNLQEHKWHIVVISTLVLPFELFLIHDPEKVTFVMSVATFYQAFPIIVFGTE